MDFINRNPQALELFERLKRTYIPSGDTHHMSLTHSLIRNVLNARTEELVTELREQPMDLLMPPGFYEGIEHAVRMIEEKKL